MNRPEGQRLDDALDLFHDHRWQVQKPVIYELQMAELLVVLRPWFEREFTPKRSRIRTAKPVKVDKGGEARGRRLVGERSGGLCEVSADGCTLAAREWQHRKNRSQRGTWAPSNGLHACRECHSWIHANPVAAHAFGWTVWSYEDPAEVPVLRAKSWAYLLDDGGFEPVEKGAA